MLEFTHIHIYIYNWNNPFPLILNTPLETMVDVGTFHITGTIYGVFNIRIWDYIIYIYILYIYIYMEVIIHMAMDQCLLLPYFGWMNIHLQALLVYL